MFSADLTGSAGAKGAVEVRSGWRSKASITTATLAVCEAHRRPHENGTSAARSNAPESSGGEPEANDVRPAAGEGRLIGNGQDGRRARQRGQARS